jgi:hypothetical protein
VTKAVNDVAKPIETAKANAAAKPIEGVQTKMTWLSTLR